MWPYLSDCVSSDPSKAEIFILQDRFGAAAKRVRDRMTQAVLPIEATIIKVDKARLDELLDNDEIKGIIAALGVGIDVDETSTLFDIGKLRYGKIIIVVDAGGDGTHISSQVLAFLRRFNYPVVAAGHVYLCGADMSVRMGDEQFTAKVMAPATRGLVRVEPGPKPGGRIDG